MYYLCIYIYTQYYKHFKEQLPSLQRAISDIVWVLTKVSHNSVTTNMSYTYYSPITKITGNCHRKMPQDHQPPAVARSWISQIPVPRNSKITSDWIRFELVFCSFLIIGIRKEPTQSKDLKKMEHDHEGAPQPLGMRMPHLFRCPFDSLETWPMNNFLPFGVPL